MIGARRSTVRLGRYHGAMRAVVRHHGGIVEKFAGDAVMAVSGTPAAHEDATRWR